MKFQFDTWGIPAPARADYGFRINNDCIEITDHDKGGVSVTNDIELVLAEIAFRVARPIQDYAAIYYRDSTMRWDRIVVAATSRIGYFDCVIRPLMPDDHDPGAAL